MKISFVIFASVFALLLGGCAEQPLGMSDEEYNAQRGPAPFSPDPMAHMPQQSSQSSRY